MDKDKIYKLLCSLGFKLRDKGAYWQTSAIFRNGDNHTAIQIYKDSGVWKDYVSQSKFMPLKRLVEVTLGTNDPKTISKYFDFKEPDFYESKRVEKACPVMEKIYDEKGLEKLLPHFSFYEKRGIAQSTMQYFKGGLATGGPMYQRIVFPIYNENRQIHGFAGRDVSPSNSKDRPKWKHVGKKTKWIYPYHINQHVFNEAVLKNDSVILVESIGDMLALFEKGFKNVLVTFGLDISPQLICFLISLCAKKIILSFNNDVEQKDNRGLNACVKGYLNLIKFIGCDNVKICLPTKNDFGDMSEQDFVGWREKLDKVKELDQLEQVNSLISALAKSKFLSKNILKNRKYINECG